MEVITFFISLMITAWLLDRFIKRYKKELLKLVEFVVIVSVGIVTLLLMQSGAVEASALVVPGGVIAGAILTNSLGV